MRTIFILVAVVAGLVGGMLYFQSRQGDASISEAPLDMTPMDASVDSEESPSLMVIEEESEGLAAAGLPDSECTVEDAESCNVPTTESSADSPYSAHAQSRINVIEKFFDLSDVERDLMAERFDQDAQARIDLVIDDVLGKQAGDAFRGHLKSTLQRSAQRAMEKDAVYLAKELGLNDEQEGKLTAIFEEVERQVQGGELTQDFTQIKSPREVLAEQLASGRLRQSLRRELIAKEFSEEVVQQYDQLRPDTADAELQLWHDSGPQG